MKKHIHLLIRTFKLFATFPKPLLLSEIIASMFDVTYPFVNLYFSAQILNELTGARNADRLVLLTTLTLSINFILHIIINVLWKWRDYCQFVSSNMMYKIYNDKMLSMDYIDLENPEIQKEHAEIREHINGMGFGLPRFLWNIRSVISGFLQIIISVTFAFSLFTLKVPGNSPYAYLDSLPAVVIVLLVLACSILLSPYISTVGGRIWAKAAHDNNKSNRSKRFYFYTMTWDKRNGMDIRIYNQKQLIKKDVEWMRERDKILESYSNYAGKFNAVSSAVSQLSGGFIYLYATLKAFAGAFGIGGIVQYVGAITQFGNGFASVMMGMGQLINNNVFIEKSFRFLDIPNRKYKGTLSVEKRDDNEYEIAFQNVSFRYPGADKYALKGLNFKFNIGKRVAVVGMNGSGKTTMIKLLCRLYDPDEGIITLNGIDIKKYDYDEYMAIFSVVFQDFRLLPFTLGQNVAASFEYDEKAAIETIKKVGFGLRLDDMNKGLDTYLYKGFEEDGVEISGGEEQKIALARALYKDAPFIILDEPTASLDPIAEYEIYSKFNEIVGEKTAVYISHRLSSCRFCDDIAVFHEGELIQRGSHEDLLSDKKGKYYELWNAQAKYYQT